MILLSADIRRTSLVGQKTLNLKRLQEAGFKVPPFVALPSSVVRKIITARGVIKASIISEVLKEIKQALPFSSYAVRSSALLEDSRQESFAGQFKTRVDVKPTELFQAISEVLTQARMYLKGDIDAFSIIIQQYIEPMWSGVAFTRDPQGGRQLVVEFHEGRGEEVVEGRVKPERIEFYTGGELAETRLPHLGEAITEFKKIEQLYNFPQDIEWCVEGQDWYFLQTRPITSLSELEYQQSVFLDQSLPVQEPFYLKKTEITEAAPRPTTLMLDLLKNMYGKGGLIERVYKKYKITYRAQDFLKVVGTELYCDREKELATLLPAYSFLASPDLKPRIKHIQKLFVSLKNSFYLQRIPLKNYEFLFKEIKRRLESSGKETTVPTALNALFSNYELIFEVNLLAGVALKRLELMLKKEVVSMAELLNSGTLFFPELSEQTIQLPPTLVGNSLDIADESVFMRQGILSVEKDKTIEAWWTELSSFKKNTLQSFIKNALFYARLREYGRWLTVKTVHQLRKILLSFAKHQSFENPRTIYFAELAEILEKNVSEEVCKKREAEYGAYNSFIFSNILTNVSFRDNSSPQGVSPGRAQGILVGQEDLRTDQNKSGSYILYTKILSPDLTRYFKHIKGIVSESGGILSHLAIVAREKHVPVIVNVRHRQVEDKLGKIIEIDGATGEIGSVNA